MRVCFSKKKRLPREYLHAVEHLVRKHFKITSINGIVEPAAPSLNFKGETG